MLRPDSAAIVVPGPGRRGPVRDHGPGRDCRPLPFLADQDGEPELHPDKGPGVVPGVPGAAGSPLQEVVDGRIAIAAVILPFANCRTFPETHLHLMPGNRAHDAVVGDAIVSLPAPHRASTPLERLAG